MDLSLLRGTRGSLHILVDPITSKNPRSRVKDPRVGWANSMERGGREATERDEKDAYGA